jgi:hypothetical protein
MAMITPLIDTGKVRGLKHSIHIFICFFISYLSLHIDEHIKRTHPIIAVQNYKKIAEGR